MSPYNPLALMNFNPMKYMICIAGGVFYFDQKTEENVAKADQKTSVLQRAGKKNRHFCKQTAQTLYRKLQFHKAPVTKGHFSGSTNYKFFARKGFATITVLLVVLQLSIFAHAMLQSMSVQHKIYHNILLGDTVSSYLQKELQLQWLQINISQIDQARLQQQLAMPPILQSPYPINTKLIAESPTQFQLLTSLHPSYPAQQNHSQIIVFSSTSNIVYHPLWQSL